MRPIDQTVLASIQVIRLAEPLADLLDGVLALAALGGEEAGPAGLVLQDPLAGELARLDLAEDLLHLDAGLLVDDPGAAGVVAVLGGVARCCSACS